MHVKNSITINRPVEEVFDFVTNYQNNSKWQTGVIVAEFTSPGPVSVGSTFRYDADFMGRKMETTGEITAYDPPQIFGWKSTSGPFPMSGSTSFESVEGGTLITDSIGGEPGGFFKIAAPLLAKQLQDQSAKDLEKLKKLLEK